MLVLWQGEWKLLPISVFSANRQVRCFQRCIGSAG